MSIKIENVEVSGWKATIRGARNPMNSWEKSDSVFISTQYCDEKENFELAKLCGGVAPIIKENDHKLLMNLCKGGSEESKWRRFVHVSMDITAPLYWWKEFETYKVGTACNSCSTMHKIQAKEFTLEDFSCEHLFDWPKEIPVSFEDEDEANWHYENGAWLAYEDWDDHDDWVIVEYALDILKETITALNYYRKKFLETKDKKYWYQMIQLLPSSYNQRRTIDLNYEVLAAQYRQRKNHKLDEWREYCEWIKSLPYSELITMEE